MKKILRKLKYNQVDLSAEVIDLLIAKGHISKDELKQETQAFLDQRNTKKAVK